MPLFDRPGREICAIEATSALEKARREDLKEILSLYEAVHDTLEFNVNWPQWRRNVYPAPRDARRGFEAGALFVLRDPAGGTPRPSIAATMILNHDQPAAYANARWAIKAASEQVAVVHTFMVHPAYARGGYGEKALRAAHALARSWGCACVRLDTYEGNVPAQSLYEKIGYRKAGKIDLKLTKYGRDEFWVIAYEFVL
jgi:ribosomal protein S18 acetylase RimI-like enzyme